jgi:hypothetical protein
MMRPAPAQSSAMSSTQVSITSSSGSGHRGPDNLARWLAGEIIGPVQQQLGSA